MSLLTNKFKINKNGELIIFPEPKCDSLKC